MRIFDDCAGKTGKRGYRRSDGGEREDNALSVWIRQTSLQRNKFFNATLNSVPGSYPRYTPVLLFHNSRSSFSTSKYAQLP
jgi:hypothetical protein